MRRFPSSGGVEVAAHDLGGGGDALLLAHAAGFHAQVWEPVARRLGTRFHCYGLDFRGHGDAVTPEGVDYDWNGFADDVSAAVSGLRLERPWAVGHSSGAAGLLLAEAARPGSFRGIYCYEAVVAAGTEPKPSRTNALADRTARRREVFPSVEAAHEHYAGRGAFSTLSAEGLRAYVDHGFAPEAGGGVRLKCRAADEAAIYRRGFSHAAFRLLPTVRCPVHLVCGQASDSVGPTTLARLAERLPTASVEVIPGLHHLGPMEDPDAVAASVVRAFGA